MSDATLPAIAGENTPEKTPDAERAAMLAKLEKVGVTRDDLVAAGIIPEPRRAAPTVHSAGLSETGGLSMKVCATQVAAVDAALGSSSQAFQAYATSQLLNILRVGREGDDLTLDLNAALAMLAAVNPQDELEAMLAAQMVATHHLGMRQLNKHAYADNLAQHDAHGNMANKFLRTFTTQMEALSRWRNGGKPPVGRVNVNAGDQAVIAGTVNTTKGPGA